MLYIRDFLKALNHTLRRNPSEIVTLASRYDRCRDPMRFGRRQDKDRVRRRFLKRFQKCIECTAGKHMNLVDDIDFKFRTRRKKHDLITYTTNIIDTVVRRGVHFDDIHKRAIQDTPANLALVAGIAVPRRKTIHSPRKNLCNGSLAGAPGTRKQISMRNCPRNHSLTEGGNSMLLLDNLIKGGRAKSPVQCYVSHINRPPLKNEPLLGRERLL